MDILRKSIAPISDLAWAEINERARVVLTSHLSARRFVDVDGPRGWDFASVSTGRIQVPEKQTGKVKYGIHQVLPLVETRIPFELNIWELDNLARGAKDPDLSALEAAAREIALFEENAIYEGFKHSGLKGLRKASEFAPMVFPSDIHEIVSIIAQAVSKLKAASVEGPYSLVLSQPKWEKVNTMVGGYPLKKQLESILGGTIIMAPGIDNAYLVSKRGGDFQLVIGQDLSIGYESHTSKSVQLFFTESFTFQCFDPAAYIVFE
jgi:uncharacterized linocin/CFP29 family protein